MQTCPKDGSLLIPKRVDGKKILVCLTCNHTQSTDASAQIKETVTKKSTINVIDDSDSDAQHPIIDAECPKCKNTKAHYWLVQTRAGDEPATRFFKCTTCKHIWREY